MKVEEFEDKATGKTASGSAETVTPKLRRSGIGFVFFALLLAVLGVVGWFVYKGITARVSAENKLVTETQQSSVLTVSVTKPKISGQTQELILPGNTQP